MSGVDVVVVGSGPAGSAAAARLAAGGARVVLVERARHPRPKACAEYASPRILEELSRLGLPPAVWADHAVPLDGMELHAGGRVARIAYADRAGAPRTAWGLDRRRFDAALAAGAATAGADVREGITLIGVRAAGRRVDGVTLRTDGGRRQQTVSADWVIGADGARSTVARIVGVERHVRFPRRLGLVAHYAGADDLRAHGEMHVGSGTYVGMAPTPDGELNVGMALPMVRAGHPAAARFDAAIAALPAVARRLSGATRVSPIRGQGPIGHRVARAAGEGWLLVGDAAGFVDPFTGEGIYRALRSGRAAADAILACGDVAVAYERRRRRAFAAKSALTWLIQGFLAAPPLLEHAVGRLATRPASALMLGSVLGDLRPATDALAPRALLEVLGP